MTASFADVDSYLAERTGCYEWRAVRYRAAADFLVANGLCDDDTVCDVGAGWTEFDYTLRHEYGWRGRYIPLDAGISNLDLNTWTPYRSVSFYVALEILEHLHDPSRLISSMQMSTHKAIVCSVPNPRTVDVIAIDDTHVSIPDVELFTDFGFDVQESTFYGGVYSDGHPDALLATWRRTQQV